MRGKLVKVLAGVVLFLLMLFLFHSFILAGYARFFEVSNPEKGADAIICLSGGKLTRVPKSIRLWSEGYLDILTKENLRTPNLSLRCEQRGLCYGSFLGNQKEYKLENTA